MFKNYLKIAWRNLTKDKAYALLNISGLAIGMACSILILFWVQNELSYDKFHAKADQIYRLTATAGSEEFKAALSTAGMAEGFSQEIPEIESAMRLSRPYTTLFEVENLKFEEKRTFYADHNFLEMFSFPLLRGDSKTALERPDGILITETIAKKYFGEKEALGKTIKKDNNENFVVTGILADIPANSHIQFDIVLPMAHLAKTNRDLIIKTWESFDFYTYIRFSKDAVAGSEAYSTMVDKINHIFVDRNPEDEIGIGLQALTDIHLRSDLQFDIAERGNIQYVNIFFIIAFVILIVACINFMNLATARSSRRAKEVGLRKVVGARRGQLIFQFLGESLLICSISLMIAIGLVYLLLPSFNAIAGKQLDMHLFDGDVLWSLLVIALLTGIISGSYPAFFLSGFRPISVLRGKLKLHNSNVAFRNGLVVTQFVVSVLLLVGTAVVYHQLQYIKNKNLGFDKENLIYIPMKGEILNKEEALKSFLDQNPSTNNYTIISDLPANLLSGTMMVDWEGKDPNHNPVIPNMRVDENFVEVFKMKMLSGRGFSKEFAADSINYMVNETAASLMGMDVEGAIGQNISFQGNRGSIIGVVKDFNFKPLQYAIEPLVLEYRRGNTGIVVVGTTTGNTEGTIDELEKIYGNLNPVYPFSYGFIDKDLESQYRGEQKMGNIFNLFALLAIFISCLGLYGLAAFMAERRFKEIGIRKVLGASVPGLINMLSRDFLRLVLIAFVIAVPLAWYFMSQWLTDFAYHINMQWWMFALAGLVVFFIALTTVSFQTVRVANTNPVKSLRTE